MFETDGYLRRATRRLGAGVVAFVVATSSSAAGQAPAAPPAETRDAAAPVAKPAAPTRKSQTRRAQAPRAKHAARELTAEEQDAAAVLDSLVEQARGIDDQATRIRVEGRVAELLYEQSPERGRKLYRRVFDEIESLNESSIDPSYAPVGARLSLRVELLSTLYGVDPVLAAQLAATLDEDPENYDGGGMPFESQSDMSATLLRVAQSLVSSDPELASNLARQGITTGVPVEFAILLPALGESNRTIADSLAGEALRIAGESGISLIDVAGALPYLFPEVEQYGQQQAGTSTRDTDLRKFFLSTAYNVSARYASGLNTRLTNQTETLEPWSIYGGEGLAVNYEIAEQIAPLFDSVDPERSAAFRGLTSQIASAMPVELHSSISASLPKASVETPEGLAAKAETITDARSREELYGRAATLAADRGDLDLARSYAGRIEDDSRRSSVRSTVALQAIRTALAERRYDDARKLAKDIVEIRLRASAYTQIASEMIASGKRQMAADCLDEAQLALIKDGAVMTREKAEALVRIANAYAALDPARGFEVMRSALDAVNTGLRRVDGVAPTSQAQAKQRNPGVVFQLSALDPSSGLEVLARADYFRSMGLAQRLDSKALTVLAQIGVVRGVLRSRHVTPSAVRAPAPAEPAPAAPVVKPTKVAAADATVAPPKPGTPVPEPAPEAEP